MDERELRVNSIYRELDLEIITSKAELPLILREIAKQMEDMIDAAKDEADLIEILAL